MVCINDDVALLEELIAHGLDVPTAMASARLPLLCPHPVRARNRNEVKSRCILRRDVLSSQRAKRP